MAFGKQCSLVKHPVVYWT